MGHPGAFFTLAVVLNKESKNKKKTKSNKGGMQINKIGILPASNAILVLH